MPLNIDAINLRCNFRNAALFVVCFFSFFVFNICAAEEGKGYDIYLLIGQSNMAGRAEITDELNKAIDGVFVFDGDGKWVAAKPPLNIFSTVRKDGGMQKLNPGVGFSKKMLEKHPEKQIGLVVNARGNTKVDEWNSKESNLYQEAIKRIKLAANSGNIKGVLWHQGEANCKDPDYIKKVSKLIASIREDLNLPELPFVAGQINGDYPFNKYILSLPKNVPFTGVVSSEGLTAMDEWHFDTQSMILLGDRYAEVMEKLHNMPKIMIEAEDAEITPPMQIIDDAVSSNGKCCITSGRDTGQVTFKFNVPNDGKYSLWLMGRGVDGTKDSFYYSIDGQTQDIIDVAIGDKPSWNRLAGRKNAKAIHRMTKGEHTITITGREPGAQIDKILVTPITE